MAMAPLRRGDGRIPTLDGRASPEVPQGLPVPDMTAGRSTVPALLGERIGALVQRRQDRHDATAREEAAAAGAAQGEAEPGALMEGGGAIYQDAFNRAAVETGARRLELNARETLDGLAREHEADPAAFGAAATRYRDGLVAELPPAMRTRVLQGFDTLARPYGNQIIENQQRAVAGQAVASFNEAMPARIAAVERLAGRALRDPAAAQALDAEEAGILGDLVAMGPRTGFRLGGRDYAADPTRAGALTIDQLQQQMQRVGERRNEAMVLGAWRASGGGAAWIDEWARRESEGVLGATDGASLRDRIFRAENPASDARRNPTPGSTASGPGQITDGAWNTYAPRLGLTAGQRNDRAAQERVFDAYMADAATRIGRPLTDGEAYAAWGLGIGGLAAFLAAGRDAGALTTYRRAAGEATANRAFESNGDLMRPGMTVGDVLDAFARRVGGGAAAAPASGLPVAEVRRIERLLRTEHAQDETARREVQSAAWGQLAGTVQANEQALALTGREQTPITDAQFQAAGRDGAWIAQYRSRVAFGQSSFEARQSMGMASPEQLDQLRPRFLPGGDLFQLNPAGAAAMIGLIDRRKAEIAGSGIEARLADLRAATIAAGAAGNAGPRLAPQDGQAMGLPPERVAEVNRQLEAAERAAKLAGGAALAPAGDAQAVPGQLPVEGDQAAENAAALRAWQEAWRARERSIADSPGNHVLQHDQATREAWNAALQDPAKIGAAIAMTLSLQERVGVRAADRQAIPPSIATAIAGIIGELPTAAERMSRLQDILGRVPEEAQRQQLLAGLGTAGLPDGLRIGAAIAPRVGPLVASQIASELAVDASKLTLPPGMTQQVQRAVTGVFDDSDRLGGLRAAQAEVTGNAAFVELAARERRLLEHVGKVRAAASGGTGTGELRTAYGQVFGGNTIVQRSGYMLVVPVGMDAARVRQGLAGILDRALQGVTPQQRAVAARGTWVDGGTGQYVFYPAGSPSPLARDGAPLLVTPAEAQAAPAATLPAQPRPGPTVVPPTMGMVLPPFGFR